MVKKDLTLSAATWAKLKIIKDGLSNKEGKKIASWEACFDELFKYYEIGKGKISPSSNDPLKPNIPAPKVPENPPAVASPKLPPMKISLSAPKLAPPKLATPQISLGGSTGKPNSSLPTNASEFNEENIDLNIPPPPKKKALTITADAKTMQDLAAKETAELKFILIECAICGTTPIAMPVIKKYVLDAKEPVVEITYIHGNPKHAIVAQLDHDFQVRRNRPSKAIFEDEIK